MNRYRQIKRIRLASLRAGQLVAVMMLLFIGLVGVAYAARTVLWFDFVNSGSVGPPGGIPSQKTVYSNANFSVWVRAQTTGSGTANDWQCTRFAFTGPSTVTRTSDTPNITTASTTTVEHVIQAPTTSGLYNLAVTAWSGNGCTGTGSTALTINTIVNVITFTPGVVVETPLPGWGALTVTLSEDVASTWNGTEYRFGTSGAWTCVDTTNRGTGNFSETFNILAPVTVGTYTLQVRANTANNCSGTADTTRQLSVVIAENNPDLPPTCALDIILVLDESNSISNDGATTNVRNALRDILNTLKGTGSYVNVIEFGSRSRFTTIGGPSASDWRLVDQAFVSGPFETYIAGGTANYLNTSFNPGTSNSGNAWEGGTNWDEALGRANTVAARVPDKAPLVLFVTDGQPTYYTPGDGFDPNQPSGNSNPTLGGDGINFTPEGLAQAALWANQIKAKGSHILLAGFGDILSNLDKAYRVSGLEELNNTGTNFPTADYKAVTSANVGILATAIRNAIEDNCEGSLTLTKFMGTGTDQISQGWEFTTTVLVTQSGQSANNYTWEQPVQGHATSLGTSQTDLTDGGGEAFWKWVPGPLNSPQPWSTSASFNETPVANHEFISATCTISTIGGAGQTVVGPFTTLPVTLNLADNQFAVCEVHNRMLPAISVDINGPASVMPTDPGYPNFNYTIDSQNTGPTDLTNIYMDIVLPPEVKLDGTATIPDNPNGATCVVIDDGPNNDGFGGTIRCGGPGAYLKDLEPGEQGSQITLPVVLKDGGNVGTTTFEAEATIYGENPKWGSATDDDSTPTTTPVTVSYFSATETAGGVHFDWSTATETGNAGFNLYARTADGSVVRLNDEIILSTVIDSSAPTDYSVELAGVPAGEYFIEDVALTGDLRAHAAIGLNSSFGERTTPEAIDWAAIQAENVALEQARAAAAADQQSAGPRPAGPQAEQINGGATTDGAVTGSEAVAARGSAYPSLDLRLSETGIYRLTYEQIKAAGVDLRGVSRRDLALTNRGESVPLYVSRARFGPGAYIEFIGQGLDTLYTDTNVYRLVVDRAMASRVTAVQGRPSPSATFAPYYMETTTVENNNIYSERSPNGDPWLETFFNLTPDMATKYTDFPVNISDYVPGAAASVQFDLWGSSNVISGPDHHALVAVNGTQVADEWFDGYEVKLIDAPLPNNVLQNGLNTLRLTAPVDSGAIFDTFGVESYGLTYPRAFVAVDGRLKFEAKADALAFKVTGLDSNQVVVYRLNNGRPARLNGVKVAADGNGYSVGFAGGKNDTYIVSTVGALLTPQIAKTPAAADITGGTADLLIIAHPNFINNDLNRLVQARQAQGYTVKVVNVNDVYAQFGGGIFDPQAIRDYLGYAIDKMGVEYVLLVGADTYDYRNYSGVGSISFIPSLYANTLDPVKLAPVDPLYTDVDGDNVPDRAIGRFPVRTAAELKLMVDKTLLYDSQTGMQTAILAADDGFQNDSEAFASPFSDSGWAIKRAYIQSMGNSAARATLIAGLNAGPRLASFVGHSGPNHWTLNPLFVAGDAATLTNTNPILVTQWGCWNTYYVDPAYNTLGHMFLLSGMNGAALVTGSTTLTNSNSERQLGRLMMAQLAQPGMTIGEAMQVSKAKLAQTHPEMHDVLLGWTILGDPTTVVMPATP